MESIHNWISTNKKTKEDLSIGIKEIREVISTEYKEYKIKNATDVKEKYKTNREEKIKEIQDALLQNIEIKLGKWAEISGQQSATREDILFKLKTPISFVEKRYIGHLYSIADSAMLRLIINAINREGKLAKYNRVKEGEKAYLDFLEEKKFKYLIGSEFAFEPYDYEKWDEYEKVLDKNNTEKVVIEYGNTGLAMQEKMIISNVERVIIKDEPASINDIDYAIDEKSGMYTGVKEIGESIKCTKEELENYIANEYVNLIVSVKWGIRIGEAECYCIKKH